ncbi:hypothetical protein H0H87_007633 [Tephrocybe sp. NHM501043]|nr:hypothetical protein H0H87_007633 [Tephrocybe sp. NHM501043]
MSQPERETELGTLIIVILKARNLNDKHSFYKQDVFAQVTLNGKAFGSILSRHSHHLQGVTKRTPVAVKGGQHPEWDEEVRFPVLKQSTDKSRKLEVACFAKEPRSDDILGKGAVDIADTLKSGEFDEWVPLNIDGVVRGDLYLEMTFFSNAPIPANSLAAPYGSGHLQRRPSKLAPPERLSRPAQTYTPHAASQASAFRPLQSGPHHLSRPDGSEPHRHPINGDRPQHPSVAPGANTAAQAATLHNLLSDNPPVNQRPSDNAYHGRPRHHLQASPASSRSSSTSPRGRADSPLPPLPQGDAQASPSPLPSTLLPGGGRLRPQQSPSPHPHASPQLPSTLRAGPGRVVSQSIPPSHHPAHVQQPSSEFIGHTVRHSDYFSVPDSHDYGTGAALPHTLISGNNSHVSGHPPSHYPPRSSSISAPTQLLYNTQLTSAWGPQSTSDGQLLFPVPMPYTPAPGEVGKLASYASLPTQTYTPPPPQAAYARPSPQSNYPAPLPETLSYHQTSLSNEYPDPYLQARYQTPLPLPSGTENGQKPLPSSTPPAINPDDFRIRALRQIEEEAERRKAQEDKDLALALALDRELNLESEGEPTPTARTDSAMPGGW